MRSFAAQLGLGARRQSRPLLVAWFLPSAIGRYYTQMLALAGIYAIVAQGLNLLAGYTGQASLGHAGFYAIGAYTGALLATKLGFGFWSAIAVLDAARRRSRRADRAAVLQARRALSGDGHHRFRHHRQQHPDRMVGC